MPATTPAGGRYVRRSVSRRSAPRPAPPVLTAVQRRGRSRAAGQPQPQPLFCVAAERRTPRRARPGTCLRQRPGTCMAHSARAASRPRRLRVGGGPGPRSPGGSAGRTDLSAIRRQTGAGRWASSAGAALVRGVQPQDEEQWP